MHTIWTPLQYFCFNLIIEQFCANFANSLMRFEFWLQEKEGSFWEKRAEISFTLTLSFRKTTLPPHCIVSSTHTGTGLCPHTALHTRPHVMTATSRMCEKRERVHTSHKRRHCANSASSRSHWLSRAIGCDVTVGVEARGRWTLGLYSSVHSYAAAGCDHVEADATLCGGFTHPLGWPPVHLEHRVMSAIGGIRVRSLEQVCKVEF